MFENFGFFEFYWTNLKNKKVLQYDFVIFPKCSNIFENFRNCLKKNKKTYFVLNIKNKSKTIEICRKFWKNKKSYSKTFLCFQHF